MSLTSSLNSSSDKNHGNEVSHTSSPTTSSKDVFSTSIEQGDVFLCSEDQNFVNICNGLSPEPGSQSLIYKSDYAHIGNTVHLNVEHANINIQEKTSSQPAENDLRAAQKSTQKLHNKFRCIALTITIIVFLLLIITTALILFRNSIYSRDLVFPPIDENTTYYISGHPVYAKNNWGAFQEVKSYQSITFQVSIVIISHSDTEICRNFTECAHRTQRIQYNFLEKGYKDIGYNFLIGGDGGIYVGAGWDNGNCVRADSLVVAFIGDFNKESLNDYSADAAQALIAEGVKLGKIDNGYKLVGENQTSPMRFYSPGRNVVKVIKKWEHYFPGTVL